MSSLSAGVFPHQLPILKRCQNYYNFQKKAPCVTKFYVGTNLSRFFCIFNKIVKTIIDNLEVTAELPLSWHYPFS